MAKLREVKRPDGSIYGWLFFCPACKTTHLFSTGWQFNGDAEAPSFTPSLLIYGATPDVPLEARWPRCHLYLTEGALHYLADSEHGLAEKSVPLPDCPGIHG